VNPQAVICPACGWKTLRRYSDSLGNGRIVEGFGVCRFCQTLLVRRPTPQQAMSESKAARIRQEIAEMDARLRCR